MEEQTKPQQTWWQKIKQHPFIKKLRSCLQYIRKHRLAAITIAVVMAVMVLIFVESLINGTGFNSYYTTSTIHTISGSPSTITRTETYQPGKTLWDWLNLLGVLAIPAVVGLGAAWYTAQQGKVSDRRNSLEQKKNQQIVENQFQQALLQSYLDRMSELLLEKNLRGSQSDDEVRNVARARTLATLL